MNFELHHGDCIALMKSMPDNSIDSIVTDPPYELGFMGKSWDSSGIAFNVEVWREALRVLKPGGHLLAFSGSRTYHRMAVAIEDAGFEVRDQIMWIYGSGFPKSLDIGKKLPDWQGWGTALKPAHEPIVMARKPLIGTVTNNVLAHGNGGLNIDASRVGDEERTYKGMSANIPDVGTFRDDNWVPKDIEITVNGRWPANVIHDGNPYVVELFPNDAARFFYCAKTSKRDRNEGLDGFEERQQDERRKEGNPGGDNPRNRGVNKVANFHPTVKPTDLMRYLCVLVTPPNGTVLDPFMGSGSTGKGAILEGFNFVGIEQELDYVAIAKARIEYALTTRETRLPL